MKVELSVPEAVEMFKAIHKQPEMIFDLIRPDIKETVGQYLSSLMQRELREFLGRERYERSEAPAPNHRNGSYARDFTLKGIGPVSLRVPRDRRGEFKPTVIPRCKRYEDDLRQDLCLLFLTGISTRSLSLISEKLLVDNVERWRSRDLSTLLYALGLHLYQDGTPLAIKSYRKSALQFARSQENR